MDSKHGSQALSGVAVADPLPRGAAELRADLLRRLGLLEREVLALVGKESSPEVDDSLAKLEEMEKEMRRRLECAVDPEAWTEQRAEIVELWRRHRRAFEELATRCRQGYPARRGQRQRGPRW